MEETTYLSEGGMLITSTRIELAGNTYAVRNVGSVRVTRPSWPWFAALLALAGLFMALNGAAREVGLLLLMGAAVWIYQQVRMRRLVVMVGGSETVALQSTNGARIERIRSAVAQAISVR